MTGLSGAALASAAVAFRWGARWPRNAFHLAVGSATGLIATAVVISPDPVTAAICAALMSFIAVDAFFFFNLVVAYGYMAVGVGGVTLALHLQGEVPLAQALALDAIIVALGIVVRGLVLRASSASRDPLTGLANRRGFDDALDEAMLGTARSGVQFSVALIDVDHFKAVNDQQGHAAGDELLRTVAREWVPRLPRGAMLARHGGDEFALLLPSCPGPAARRVVEELRLACAQAPVSAGVAQHAPGESASQLMRRADTALYRAKAAGRGRSVLYGDGPGDGPAPGGTGRRLNRG